MSIIQGSKNPLVVTFDDDVSGLAALRITLWSDLAGSPGTPLKMWTEQDVTIQGETVICPLTEAETAAMPMGTAILEIKGMDGSQAEIFWEQFKLDVALRRDKDIALSQAEG